MRWLVAGMTVLLWTAPLSPGQGSAAAPVFALSIPELGMEVGENSTAALPHRFLNELQIHIGRNPQELPYGQIFVRINGEAANIIMSSQAEGQGILLTLNLNLRPGFVLLPGRNSVETWARNIYGRFFYASFLLDVEDEPASVREIRVEALSGRPGARPPVVRLVEPLGPVEDVDEVRLAGYVEGASGPVNLRVDGRDAALGSADLGGGARGIRLDPGGKRRSFDLRVKPQANRDMIEVLVEDTAASRTRLMIPVLRGTRRLAEHFAVVIGISRYKDPRLNLRFARHDAESMRDFLLDPKGGAVPPANLLYLTDQEATGTKIRTAINTFLTRPRAEDLTFIYYAGHGAPDPKRPNNLYLLPYDVEVDNMGGTAVPMWELQAAFERTIRGPVVALVDACHSAGVGQSLQNLTHQGWTRLGQAPDRAVITASNINEFSLEDERWGGGHGVFTYYLLRGLGGQADRNHDRQVSVGELFDYVRVEVPQATSGNQTPTAIAGLARGLVMVRNPTPDAAPAPQLSPEVLK
jgi:hypothetical protein